jgi:hypothetical protein
MCVVLSRRNSEGARLAQNGSRRTQAKDESKEFGYKFLSVRGLAEPDIHLGRAPFRSDESPRQTLGPLDFIWHKRCCTSSKTCYNDFSASKLKSPSLYGGPPPGHETWRIWPRGKFFPDEFSCQQKGESSKGKPSRSFLRLCVISLLCNVPNVRIATTPRPRTRKRIRTGSSLRNSAQRAGAILRTRK